MSEPLYPIYTECADCGARIMTMSDAQHMAGWCLACLFRQVDETTPTDEDTNDE
jgi:hypothetical protein